MFPQVIIGTYRSSRLKNAGVFAIYLEVCKYLYNRTNRAVFQLSVEGFSRFALVFAYYVLGLVKIIRNALLTSQ